MTQKSLEMTKDLVMAQIQAQALLPDDRHNALHHTYTSLMTLESAGGRTWQRRCEDA